MCVNNLPKVATQWNSGATWDSNRGRRVLIPSALTTRPPRHATQASYCFATSWTKWWRTDDDDDEYRSDEVAEAAAVRPRARLGTRQRGGTDVTCSRQLGQCDGERLHGVVEHRFRRLRIHPPTTHTMQSAARGPSLPVVSSQRRSGANNYTPLP